MAGASAAAHPAVATATASGWVRPVAIEADDVIAQLNTEFDEQKKIDLQIELDKTLWSDFYGVTIFQFPEVTAVSDRVTNVTSSILAPTVFWNAWDWQVADSGSEE